MVLHGVDAVEIACSSNAAFGAGTCQRDRDRAEQLPFDVRLRARKSLDRFRPTFRLEGTRHEWAYIHG